MKLCRQVNYLIRIFDLNPIEIEDRNIVGDPESCPEKNGISNDLFLIGILLKGRRNYCFSIISDILTPYINTNSKDISLSNPKKTVSN
jgi:hypothetical protein